MSHLKVTNRLQFIHVLVLVFYSLLELYANSYSNVDYNQICDLANDTHTLYLYNQKYITSHLYMMHLELQ